MVLLGSDSPDVGHAVIEHAFEALQGGSQLVLGPARDGGFYLIGATAAPPGFLEV